MVCKSKAQSHKPRLPFKNTCCAAEDQFLTRRQSEWQLHIFHQTLWNPEFSAKEHRCSYLRQQPEASCQHISPFQEKNRHKYQIYAKFSLNSNFPLFPYFKPIWLVLPCPPHIFWFLSACLSCEYQPRGFKMACILQKSTLFYIQQLPQAPYQDKCHSPSGSQCCFPRSQKSFPRKVVL